jgi:hypothetical protein
VVLRPIADEPVERVSREIGVRVFKRARWRERAEAALDGALKERESDSEGPELAAALQRIGELGMEVELLRAKMGGARFFGPQAVAVMAGSVSPATGRACRVARVCRIWEEPRSGFHLARRLAQDPPPVRPEGRRGPKPEVSDAVLPDAIRADLARSPSSGPGRARGEAEKAGVRWTAAPPNARSGRGCGCRTGSRVARKRVQRRMREHALLSPHRTRPRPDEARRGPTRPTRGPTGA